MKLKQQTRGLTQHDMNKFETTACGSLDPESTNSGWDRNQPLLSPKRRLT
jgi:hypothetical protein